MKILAVQNRKGIGDTVIFLPFIKAISEKYSTPIDILVRENSKAEQFLTDTKYINNIHILDRNDLANGKHDGFLGALNLIKYLKNENFEKIFIFNSSLRFSLIARLAGIKKIFQYPLFNKNKQHITDTAQLFLKNSINIENFGNPTIEINRINTEDAKIKFNIDKNSLNILLGIGGSGPTKRIPSKTFIKLMEKIIKEKNCKFFLATGKNDEEQKILKDIINSEFGKFCISLDNLSIKETLPVIQNCNVAICNDTSFSHLSAALGVNTITLMADTPLIYGSYSSKMHPIIPDGEINVTHNTMGKDRINPDKIFEKFIEILN
ncbi:glycosyltransferase family 9 protein [Candidatus Pelagibacter communis]|uniref:glycosyltransferase family 9 protein n=1 Tax=Candidatus Pelagibacter TaxID=198251 RepID=UPI003EE3C571